MGSDRLIPASQPIRDWMTVGLDLVMPPVCCFCRSLCRPIQTYPGICHRCLALLPLRFGQDRVLYAPHRPIGRRPGKAFDVFCATFYRSPIREALVRLKFSDAPELSVALGSLLTPLLRHMLPLPTALVAVPLHEQRLKARGYNQSALLVEQINRQTELPDLSAGLIRRRNTLRQSELSGREARQHNMLDAFALLTPVWQLWLNDLGANRSLQTEHVILVDDVLTTGATLLSAARPLLQAGFRVSGLVIASDQGALRQGRRMPGDLGWMKG